MNSTRRIIIIGATSAIAEHCARLWAQAGPVELVLVARDVGRTERIAADLRVRGPQARVSVLASDFEDPAAIERTVEAAFGERADLVLIAHGMLPDQGACEQDIHACRQALEINAISPVLFAEACARRMAARNHGTIALIGSVAGDRGRKSNYVYGAAKGLVDRYAQGMRHRFAGSGVKVVLIKPGPTDTPMTAHLKGRGAKLAPVEAVAASIVRGIDAGQAVLYVPGKWRVIMLIIRHLPAFVFNKMNI
ncbi:SDR family NAD(P)-dependent oxidoreductase [Massilia sp.]|uniref:SDR family NAD(P)-dependent oxidoreductase n=1 Tax=Massilia sp. TaxID=1882437 RepID=UPI0028AC3716|nr:SDR family NAD(P)-dependent oxidoreductase [Massilia sp.]